MRFSTKQSQLKYRGIYMLNIAKMFVKAAVGAGALAYIIYYTLNRYNVKTSSTTKIEQFIKLCFNSFTKRFKNSQ